VWCSDPRNSGCIGLKGEGSDTVLGSGEGVVPGVLTRVKEMRLGDTKLPDQPLIVSSLPQFLTDRGDRPPLVGFFGYVRRLHGYYVGVRLPTVVHHRLRRTL
jgi:hypothetical protein